MLAGCPAQLTASTFNRLGQYTNPHCDSNSYEKLGWLCIPLATYIQVSYTSYELCSLLEV